MKHRGPGEPDRPHASGGRWARRDPVRGRHGRRGRPPYADERPEEPPSQVGAWAPRGPGVSGPQPSAERPWAADADDPAPDAAPGTTPGTAPDTVPDAVPGTAYGMAAGADPGLAAGGGPGGRADRGAGGVAGPYPDDGADEPALGPAEVLDIDPGGAEPRRRRGALLVAVLAIAAAVLATAVTLSHLELRELRRTEEAAAEALATARSYASVMMSYDHRSIEQDLARAAGHATERLAARYRRLAETLVPEAKRDQAVQQVRVTGAAVESATPERVRVLMLINRTTSKLPPGAKSRRSEVVLGRVRFVMVKGGDGAWRVDELTTLLGDPPART